MTGVAGSCQQIQQRIGTAAQRVGRVPQSVQLIAVTKTVEPARIQEARACGVKHIGENRVQEALSKREPLSSVAVTWHFIGHLQTNKARKIIENFDWVHSIDRIEAAEALARHVVTARFPVLIEVKLHDEPNKSGVSETDLPNLISSVRKLDSLDLRGLMAVPPAVEEAEEARPYFQRLRRLASDFGMAELSMGMTHDFEVAVEEGATMVRIGTGLFGTRS
jgi:pyridoxal phosphate enzyme (YggS family)